MILSSKRKEVNDKFTNIKFITNKEWNWSNTNTKYFKRVSLGKCEQLEFEYCKFVRCDWEELFGCVFINCTFENCSIENSIISETRFENCTFNNTEFLYCLIQSTVFIGGEIRDCTFWGSKLVDVYLDNLVGFVGLGEVEVDNVIGLELSISEGATTDRIVYDMVGDYIFSKTVSGRSSVVLSKLKERGNCELLAIVQELIGGS